MNNETWVDPRKLGAVVYDVGVAVDELLLTFARDLAARGERVGGVIKIPPGGPGCGPRTPMRLYDVATGEAFPLCQDLGRHAEDCSLDPAMFRHAAVRIRAATEMAADLVFLSRFGKEEARGRGFREELAYAVQQGRAFLTAVPRGLVESFLSFTDGVGTLLDARLWVLEDWWRELRGGGPPRPGPGRHPDAGDTPLPVAPSDTAEGAISGCRSGSGAGPMKVGETVRWVEAVQEFELPAVPFPSRRIFDGAGEECLRRLVRRHHENLRRSGVASLFPQDDAVFEALVSKVADYVVEACGGPARFTPAHGNTCMRTRHFSFTIDERARETWLICLWRAFDDVGFPQFLRREYWDWIEPFSARMINRRTMRAQPPRFPFDAMLARVDSN
jgi:truncated hemoglobin YjbI